MLFKTNVTFLSKHVHLLKSLLCSPGIVTFCQTKLKSTQNHYSKQHAWNGYFPQNQVQNQNLRTQHENLSCHCGHQRPISQQAAAEAHCTVTDKPPCVRAGPSRILTLRTLQSPLFRTNTRYVLFDVFGSGHLGL